MNDIAIIIPTFNSKLYILDAINSIIQQSISSPIKIYIVDDNSSDNTIEIIESINLPQHINIEILKNTKNMKQGYSRNRALKLVNEEYVLFLDSDDYLNENALKITLESIQLNKADIVFIDWIYHLGDKGKYSYRLNNIINDRDYLIGKECADLLALNVYYSVPALYRTSFLKDNNITYGEGYFYEDYEFMVQIAMLAKRIDFVHKPLYVVRTNNESTTSSNHHDNTHIDSLICALESCNKYLFNRSEYAIYYFHKYAINKALYYIRYRAPRKNSYKNLKRVLKVLSLNKGYPTPLVQSKRNQYIFENRLIDNQKVFTMLKMYINIKFKNKVKKKMKKTIQNTSNRKIKNNKIVFYGYDLEYKGNSRYLYEMMDKHGFDVVF
ncbi:MAG: glycosyltransferase family 2 protein, partial [Erysipelotrichales bacterium]